MTWFARSDMFKIRRDEKKEKAKLVQQQINSQSRFNVQFGKWWEDQHAEYEFPEKEEKIITLTEEVYNDKNIDSRGHAERLPETNGKLYCGPTAEAIIPGIVKLVTEYRDRGDAIILLADAHDADDLEFERFPAHCVAGTDGAQLIDEIEEVIEDYDNFEIVEKTRYSGFYDTWLEDSIEFDSPDEVEVVGICTSICVMDTVGGLANRDYNIVVYKDLVADFDQEMHEFALKRMESLYGVKYK